MLMDLLHGLGVNQTVLWQMVGFAFTYLVLYFLLFRPFFEAYTERVNRTFGQAELAEKYIEEAKVFQRQYEEKAQELNQQFKNIFTQSRAQANKMSEEIMMEARQKAKDLLSQNQSRMKIEEDKIRKELQVAASGLSESITQQLLKKGVAQ
ncbi:MAG: ATP synthase F0 subunit B [Bdellovibrionales bacterium]|nr:ATP synthase F0 subunit B [Bdellovibrionales bacterium]